MNTKKFSELNLSEEILNAINDLGFEATTPIQSEAIPVIADCVDVIGQAQTGTGKTAAFALPIIERINTSSKATQAIILCPTRELAIQVSEEVNKFSKYIRNLTFLPVYGGAAIDRQIKALRRGVHIVIGTPGRVMDHIDRGTLRLNQVEMFVLDEADEMLNMGFREDIESILSQTPEERQTIMFSATMPKAILELAKNHMKEPQVVKVVDEVLTVPAIDQYCYEVRGNQKIEALARLIDFYNIKLGLVFSNTKREVDEIVGHLRSRGYEAEGLHGDMKQGARDKVMGKFRKNVVEILVATDVAARGIDVTDVEAVFNYDLPQDTEYYVHRIGRTGRAGKSGYAFTFITGSREFHRLKHIEKHTKTHIKIKKLPTLTDLAEIKGNELTNQVKSLITEGGLEKYQQMIEKMLDEEMSLIDVSSALLKMTLGQLTHSDDETIDLEKFDRKLARHAKSSSAVTRIHLSVGKKDGVKPGDIVGAIAGETNIDGAKVGHIEILDKFSFAEVPSDEAERICEILNGNVRIRGKARNVEIAKPKEGRGSRERDSFNDRDNEERSDRRGRSDRGDRGSRRSRDDDRGDRGGRSDRRDGGSSRSFDRSKEGKPLNKLKIKIAR